jgi:hypothetical protein
MDKELTGKRCLHYSAWHRSASLARFVDIEEAKQCSYIDIDGLEYDWKGPLFLFETALQTPRYKTAAKMRELARLASIPAYLIRYDLKSELNPADPKWQDIEAFYIKKVWPPPTVDLGKVTPEQWAKELVKIRKEIRNAF